MDIKGFKIGDKIVLTKDNYEIVDRNTKLKIGDTGTIVMFHVSEYYKGHPQVTISWDRKGIGDTRDINGKQVSNCWAVSIHGISTEEYLEYSPVIWKIRDMWTRQPYVQNQMEKV